MIPLHLENMGLLQSGTVVLEGAQGSLALEESNKVSQNCLTAQNFQLDSGIVVLSLVSMCGQEDALILGSKHRLPSDFFADVEDNTSAL